eukprot:gnl/TRDRNA2_/TRDRNA2_204135_c0_seq1.p1 gnl/TRDRNA2_/TRDRNA2_204135_c0~~gnl/TRDRNA2_/TRDRNA2_204135_c0_seq1.p1  ORF type:complete len:123 (+),score=12.41 gnl/TRDRNA2_/TRDRNA2_204135_c0_seq1:467-835(+)
MTCYKDLSHLHLEFRSKGLEILAFPCNQFCLQTPGTSRELSKFVDKIGAPFRVMEAINVNEPEEHPVYCLLKQNGPPILRDFHTQFLVSCGPERCIVRRYDGSAPKALRFDIKELLSSVDLR